ncbi:MAG: pyridoxamine 5'-phosphate oxidase [Polyangia bacterium]
MTDLGKERTEYDKGTLEAADLGVDPIVALSRWLDEALAASALEPTAMNLATVGADLMPSSRIVLAKRVDAEGIRFYTNYDSKKGHELSANPRAAANFFWPLLERQVRVEGLIERTSHDESVAYFHSRPRKSQVAALASKQSAPLTSRAALEAEVSRLEQKYPTEVPLPPSWGGYLLRPRAFEFWQGRRSRLHDRIRFEHAGKGWKTTRLNP